MTADGETEEGRSSPSEDDNVSKSTLHNDDDEEDFLLNIYRLDFEQQQDDEIPRAAGGEILKRGDHVYMWCSFGSYNHHGIVCEIDGVDQDLNDDSLTTEVEKEDCPKKNSCSILIAEFTNADIVGATMFTSASTASAAVANGVAGGFRYVLEPNPSQWHLVKYQANRLECMTWRPGTCSTATPDPEDTVLCRVQFLSECRHLIPDYHVLASNCETVAVWCMTGEWVTLQGNQAMLYSNVGSLVMATAAPGLGLAAGGLAFWHSMHVGGKCKQIAERLNRDFQWYAMGKKTKRTFRLTS